MRYTLSVLVAVLLCLVTAECAQADEVVNLALGVNTISFDGGFPSDFEAGGSASASLSPHISGVGGVYYGFSHSYLRSTIGGRITATDVDNPNFSVGLGVSYVACTEPAIRPEELQAEVALGWRPYPVRMPKLIAGALGGYGLDSNKASLLLGLRWNLGAF